MKFDLALGDERYNKLRKYIRRWKLPPLYKLSKFASDLEKTTDYIEIRLNAVALRVALTLQVLV